MRLIKNIRVNGTVVGYTKNDRSKCKNRERFLKQLQKRNIYLVISFGFAVD